MDEATTFGVWTVIGIEGRAAWCRCKCGTTRQISLGALQGGETLSCGCLNLRSTRAPVRSSSFASEVATAELHGGRKRHRGGGLK
jgi:hypothetical protein